MVYLLKAIIQTYHWISVIVLAELQFVEELHFGDVSA